MTQRVVPRAGLDALFHALRERGYTVVGPAVRDGAILYEEIAGAADLPAGWTDEQAPGRYALARRDDEALFGYAVGPHSWKRYQLPPDALLFRGRLDEDGGLCDVETAPAPPRYAFVGVRPCELRATGILDRILAASGAERPDVLVIAVNCGEPGGTCFCVSMGTGPTADGGYDLALTELLDDEGGHRFLVDVGSERGAELLAGVPALDAGAADRAGAAAVHDRAVGRMGRELDTTDLRDLLMSNLDHPRWDAVADRCLSCGNCTMVCPTCFCTSVEDTTDLAGATVERRQRWDSCFALDHSEVHGGAVRGSIRARYRQWMTHKLATWIDQFGTSGCVGCGRCITWCPVGIDITEEARAIRAQDARAA